MDLRRGFKSEAARLANEVRRDLGLGPLDRLDPRRLAQHLEIPIIALSELGSAHEDAGYLLSAEPNAFSAVTVFNGHRRIIVHNDSHSESRQNSNLSHELSHPLLLHEPAPALDGTTGSRIGIPPTKQRRTGSPESFSSLPTWPSPSPVADSRVRKRWNGSG